MSNLRHHKPTPSDHLGASHFVQSALPHQPSHQEVAERAYEAFIHRGSVHGHDQEDWALAERELRSAAPRRTGS